MRSLVFLMMLGLPLQAQDMPPGEVAGAGATGVLSALQGLPKQTLKQLRMAPDKFLTEAAGLILGYGGPKGIDLEGIDTFVAGERARVRARAVADLVEADLDADGSVSRRELTAVMAAASARTRGRLHLTHAAADADKDGIATATEIWRAAGEKALQVLDEADAETLRAFMMFDLDGDGYVTLPEVSEAADALRQPV